MGNKISRVQIIVLGLSGLGLIQNLDKPFFIVSGNNSTRKKRTIV